MADYYTPTVVEPMIPLCAMLPIERLFLAQVFSEEVEGETAYYCSDDGASDLITLDAEAVRTALGVTSAETSSLTFDELPVCRTCELNMICMRCHATALESTGDMHAPSPSNCREALVRREVLIEKGTLPADYPIPAHLRHGIPDSLLGIPAMPVARSRPSTSFIPVDSLETRHVAPLRDMMPA